MKIALILDEYLAWAETNIVSVARTRSCAAALKRELGMTDHKRLTPRRVSDYRRSEGLAIGTINRELGVLEAALNYARENHRLTGIPEIRKRRGARKRTVWLRPAEIEDLLNSAREYPFLHRLIQLLLLTGQRLEAVLSLRWEQIDTTQGIIWFGDHDLPLAERRKGRGSVPISLRLRQLLDELANDTPFVLISERGSRMREINRDHWAAIVSAAGLPDLKPHDLRHTVATNLIRSQVPLIEVSKLLGHANTQVTERVYVNFAPQFLNGAVATLDKLVKCA